MDMKVEGKLMEPFEKVAIGKRMRGDSSKAVSWGEGVNDISGRGVRIVGHLTRTGKGVGTY